MNIFQHTDVQLPPDATFKISPSGIGEFFSSPVLWYKTHILKQQQFTGNTASYTGVACHYICEQYALGNKPTREQINAELDTITNPDVDIESVKESYPDLAMATINEYLAHNKPTEVESKLYSKVLDTVYVAGSCDNLTGGSNGVPGIVVDYKFVGKKPNTDTIPFNYKIQLLAYAKMYKDSGKPIDRIRIVYTVKPTKTLPIRVFVVTHQVTDDDWNLIDDTLTMIAKTVILSRTNPEHIPLLFKSMNLEAPDEA